MTRKQIIWDGKEEMNKQETNE
uniref:Uncharacterized protein n=1 Tax=Anguilla anguilla TaxID=7936 RepID=A0A0E9R5U4_ANGAN